MIYVAYLSKQKPVKELHMVKENVLFKGKKISQEHTLWGQVAIISWSVHSEAGNKTILIHSASVSIILNSALCSPGWKLKQCSVVMTETISITGGHGMAMWASGEGQDREGKVLMLRGSAWTPRSVTLALTSECTHLGHGWGPCRTVNSTLFRKDLTPVDRRAHAKASVHFSFRSSL